MDEETRRRCVAYAGRDFDQSRTVKVEVLSACYDTEWTPAEFREILASIPAEYAASAKITLEGGWGEETTFLTITYERPESEEEVQARIARCLEYVAQSRATERAEYERLKAKFG